MAFTENIQGLGGKGVDYLGSSLPNKKDYALGDYDSIAVYTALEWSDPCTYLWLFNAVASTGGEFLFSTRVISSQKGIIVQVTDAGIVAMSVGTSVGTKNIQFLSAPMVRKGKWNAVVITNTGSGNATGYSVYINGYKAPLTITDNIPIVSGSIKQSPANIAKDFNSAQVSEMDMAINTIYEGILTPSQITQFNADPFGFNNSLDINNCNLKVDYNKTTGNELTDLSVNAHTIVATGGKNFTQFP